MTALGASVRLLLTDLIVFIIKEPLPSAEQAASGAKWREVFISQLGGGEQVIFLI